MRHRHDIERPPGSGGKARVRLDAFQAARGLMDPKLASYYPEGLAAAVAAVGAPAASLPQWHLVGPELTTNGQTWPSARGYVVPVSGRVGAIAIDPTNRNHLLCGSTSGGIWESFTRGADWVPRTDSMVTLVIGAIAFDPSDRAKVYAGTGDGNSYWFYGQGILASTDGGTTWALVASGTFSGTGFYKIIVDKADGQHILAATYAGLYESIDGGATWSPQRTVKTWDISMARDGGPAAEVLAGSVDGVQRSTDGGRTWTPLTLPGAPAAWERIAVSIAPSDPSIAFVYGADKSDKPYLWQRSGGTWSAIRTPTSNEDQAWSTWYVAAAPDRVDQVYVGAFDVHRGDLTAGTWTWTNLSTKKTGDSIHPDQRTIIFEPGDPSTIYCGCDGGLFRSPDLGNTWIPLNCGLSIAEIEYLTQDSKSSRWLLAGTQDTGTIRYSGTTTFDTVGDGDGGDCAADQSQPGTCYHSRNNMGLNLSTSAGARGTFKPVGPSPSPPPGYKSLFYPPMGVAGSTVAQAGSSVFISRDRGTNWKELQLPATGQITTALCLPSSDLVYAATNFGCIYKIAWTGAEWSGPTELPRQRSAYVSAIVADPSTSGRIWFTMSQLGDGRVFRSDDGGAKWKDLTAGLPAIPINSIAVDNTNADRVWVSADVGVYQSLDGGGTWSAFCQNLPNVLVADLEFHAASRLLRAATRSRGIWEVAVDQPGSSALPQGVNACSVLQNADGSIEAFAAGTDKTLGHIRPVPGALSGWSQWESLGGVITSALATAVNDDGSREVFARRDDGALYHFCIYQTPPGTRGWSRWESLGGFFTGSPVVARNLGVPGMGGAGYLEVFARGPDGALCHNYQTSPGASFSNQTWSGWTSLGGVITSTPTAALNTDGCLSVFARQADGALGHIKQRSQGISSTWSTWQSLTQGGVIAGKPAVAVNTDGSLDVFARQADGTLGHIYQNAPASAWSGWTSVGGPGSPVLAGDPAVTRNGYGGLDAFARGIDNGLYHIYQTGPGSGWSGWESLARDLTSDPAVALRQDRGLEAFARGTGNALYHTYQTSQGSSWSSWESLGGALLGYP